MSKAITALLIISAFINIFLGGYVFYVSDIEDTIWLLQYTIDLDKTGNLTGDSMIPIAKEGDIPFLKEISEDERLYLGSIYSYKKNKTQEGEIRFLDEENNDTKKNILHRLIGHVNCAEYDEIIYVFKGDNNRVIDPPVRRKQVKEEMIGICFKHAC